METASPFLETASSFLETSPYKETSPLMDPGPDCSWLLIKKISQHIIHPMIVISKGTGPLMETSPYTETSPKTKTLSPKTETVIEVAFSMHFIMIFRNE